MSVRGEPICSEIEYTFLGIAVSTTTNKSGQHSQLALDQTAQAKQARSRRRSRALARRFVAGVFKFPVCCRRPATSDERDEQDEFTVTEVSKHLPYAVRRVPEASTQLVPFSAAPARRSQHLPHVQRKLPAPGTGTGTSTGSQLQRQVIIYPPTSGSTIPTNAQWKIGFENATRRESPLQGWSLTGDAYLGVGEPGLHFDSREDAIAYAQKYGWAYRVEGELVKRRRNKSIGAYGWVELMRPAVKT